MNQRSYRLVFSKLRDMLIAVEENATASGKSAGETRVSGRASKKTTHSPLQRLAALLPAVAPLLAFAQIVPGGAHAPGVISTQNGIPQVNVNRPSGAGGVSMNTYSQFDISKNGAILNNANRIANTQLAGYINGNPNFGPNDAAKIIVNQVNSSSASQINGYVEVAGPRAEVVIANGSGISVNGGGFINTSRSILTSGSPNFAADGSLAGFSVTGGNVTIQGAGFNGSNIDQVDLIARAVQVNAAIYAGKNLNVITGANSVDHDTLNATPIAGSGTAPAVSIDVSNLGGMYANRIQLVGTELGVGISLKGITAAQSGDLVLTTAGKLVLAGQTNASGNINASARDGIDNSGTTYAQQNVNATTSGALSNSGTLAAQQNTSISAGSVASTGTLGAGVNGDGTVTNTGDLSVSSGGAVTATGRNEGGGNTTIQGASLNLAGSNTSANSTLALTASAGDMNLSNSTTTAGGTLAANAAGTLTNDSGELSGNGVQVSAANISNAGGTMVSGSTVNLNTAGALSNRHGTIQSAAGSTVSAGSLDNTEGRVVSLNADGMTVTTTGVLVNGAGGTLGSNGALNLSTGTLANQGSVSAASDATVRAQSIDNHAGTISAGGALNVASNAALNNAGGTLTGATTTASASSIDNTNGDIDGDTLNISTPGALTNRGGSITQYGTANQMVSAGGTLDNTGGTIASNAANLTVSGQTVTNDSGTIQHAGAGTLNVKSAGALSNVAGKVQTNGALNATAASLNNSNGTITAQKAAQISATSGIVNHSGSLYGVGGLTATTQGDFDNTGGSAQSAGDLSLSVGGALFNAQGTIAANGAHGTANVSAASIDNTGGKLTNAGDGATTVTSSTGITNTGGTLGGNGDVTVNAQTLSNDAGANLVAGGVANLNVAQSINNAGGTLFGGTGLTLNQANASVINDGGTILGGLDVSVNVASLSNAGGAIRANRDVSTSGVVSGDGGMVAGRNLSLAVNGDYTNDAGNNLHADGDMDVRATGTLTNTGTLAANGALTATGANVVNAATGDINSASTTVNASGTLTNAGRIEGDTVTTNSASLTNTGTVIGNDVTVNANDVQNTGATAVIAGANRVHVYAQNSVTNADGALIYSAGNLEIAKDSTRDASGLLANQTGTLTNSAATIEADGDIDIAAKTVNNVRPGIVTQAGTPQDAGSTTLTLWTAGLGSDLSAGVFGNYHSLDFPQWNWSAGAISDQTIHGLAVPVTVTIPASQVTNLDTTAQTFSLTQPIYDHYQSGATVVARNVTTNATQWYNSLTDNGDGTVSITFWPDFDPNKNMRPDPLQVRWDIGNHDYVEKSRTTQTTTTTDQLVSAGNGATIQAQGAIRINADNGSISNDASTMAAGGDLVRRANGGSVTDTGVVLQQSVEQDTSSIFYWHQKTGGSSSTTAPRNDGAFDGISQYTTTVDALPAIATSNQNVQTDAQTISINSVNRQGQTVAGSGVTGGSADGTQTGTINGQSNRPQTVGGATGGIPNLKLPVNGLYTYNTAPGADYLIATDPRFTQYTKFISSDYMLNQLGLDPTKIDKRLGDGLYEETLIRNQVTQLTGRTFLAGFTDNLDEYTALMNSGVTYAKTFGLEPGIALTPGQMQQLTTDMVWLVSQDVTLPDGSHQSVLVPQVYLAQSSTVDLTHSGALVAGNAVNLNASGDVNNSGHIVSNLATTVIGNYITNSGIIGSAGTTAVVAVQDVRNSSGRIGGGDVVVQAGRDVINETQTYGVSKSFTDGHYAGSASSTSVDAVGTISATNSAAVIAGRDVNLNGALVQAGGNASVVAGRDLNVGTTELTTTKDSSGYSGQDSLHEKQTQNLGSAIVAGGDVATASGRNTTLTDATVRAGGNATMIAGGDLTVTAAKDASTHAEQSMSNNRSQHTASSYDETVKGSDVSAGGNVTLAAGQNGTGNLAVLGSSVSTDANGGGVKLVSTGNVTIGSVNETHDSQSWSHNEHSGFMSKQKDTDTASSHQVIANGSTVSGDTVTGAAGHDMTISGSTVAGTNDVTLAAGNNLAINTTQDTKDSTHFHEKEKSGLGSSGGAAISYGTVDQKDTAHDSSLTNNASLVGSTDGSVHLSAGADLHVTGSDLIAAQNVTGTGANITIDSVANTTHHDETHEFKKSGVTLGVAGGLVDMIQTAVDQAQASGKSQDSRASVLHTIAAVGNVAGAAESLANGTPDVKLELSFGSSSSKNTFTEDGTQQQGSSVRAGGTATFAATGNGTPGSGNLTIAGSDVNANDVLLAAKNQVNLVYSTDTDTTLSTNESKSASVGISYGTQGWGVDAAMSKAHGDANSDAAMQNNTHINGATSVTIASGGDTNIVGANVNGKQVSADIGGNLNIASVQDTTGGSAHQESSGGGVSISQAGGGGSFSNQHGDAHGRYAGVNEQAGIRAGDGGFNLNVKGNTDLKGAVIASDADDSKNTLSTGTLTFSDIQNQSNYDAHSGGFSGGASVGMAQDGTGPASRSNGGGFTPMLSQSDSGSGSATTRSAVSAGTINVTDKDHQTQDVASLNRDTADTNGTVAKLPDVNNLLDKQADMMNASSAAGQAVATQIGEIANAKQKAAKDAADQAAADGNPELAAQYQAEADKWDEGGANRVALHVAGGALMGGLGDGGFGSAFAGATGAGVSAAFAGKLNGLADQIGDATGSMTLGNVASNVLVGMGGALVGGSAGAFTASNADLYNRSTGNGDGKGGTGSEFLDRLGDALVSTATDPLGALNHALNSILPSPSGQQPPADPNPLVQANDGGNTPSGPAGAVVTPPAYAMTPEGPVPVAPGIVVPGYVPGNAILNNDGGGDAQQGASKSSGDAARLTGQQREETVANIVNGATSGEKVAVPGIGSTDIDVVAPNGDLIAVGGPAKANNLGKLGQELRIYQTIADQRGVSAQVYFAEGTPQSAINLATKILGEGNVKIFPGSK
ncbi:filamentous hemagglutinin N-terminal domain-containing protein [Paraburkholderia sp. Tr-20389]|uniref:two-partner secretion domain-containing protein n=1 Tax=Paraburkholderia sp. Tr-20389 TaxID=2703903 RepID=UPI00197E7A27|nr:hemagglutinin repeat-containing protein [Paraburkholderia sp. Tr-20389]MBN3755502.1 filamentous hemagglutinin N-terminal domain-containing protein [Paraburkholderia sp. Tr-20389]